MRDGIGSSDVARDMGTSVEMNQQYYGKQATPKLMATTSGGKLKDSQKNAERVALREVCLLDPSVYSESPLSGVAGGSAGVSHTATVLSDAHVHARLWVLSAVHSGKGSLTAGSAPVSVPVGP